MAVNTCCCCRCRSEMGRPAGDVHRTEISGRSQETQATQTLSCQVQRRSSQRWRFRQAM